MLFSKKQTTSIFAQIFICFYSAFCFPAFAADPSDKTFVAIIENTFDETTYLNPGFKSRMNQTSLKTLGETLEKIVGKQQLAKLSHNEWMQLDKKITEKLKKTDQKQQKQLGHLWALLWLASDPESLWNTTPKTWSTEKFKQLHARLTVLTMPGNNGDFRKKDGIKEHTCFQQDPKVIEAKNNLEKKKKKMRGWVDGEWPLTEMMFSIDGQNQKPYTYDTPIKSLTNFLKTYGARYLIPLTNQSASLHIFDAFIKLFEGSMNDKTLDEITKRAAEQMYSLCPESYSKRKIKDAASLYTLIKLQNNAHNLYAASFLSMIIGILYPWERANRKMVRLVTICSLHHENKTPNFFIDKYTKTDGTKDFLKECVPNFLICELIEKLEGNNAELTRLEELFNKLNEKEESYFKLKKNNSFQSDQEQVSIANSGQQDSSDEKKQPMENSSPREQKTDEEKKPSQTKTDTPKARILKALSSGFEKFSKTKWFLKIGSWAKSIRHWFSAWW